MKSHAGSTYFMAGKFRAYASDWMEKARQYRRAGEMRLAGVCVKHARDRLHDSLQLVRRARAMEVL